MIEAIIFDVDGTLWDAADPMAAGWTGVMREHFDPDFYVDGDMIRPILGRTPAELAEALMPKVPPEKGEEIFHVLSDGALLTISEAATDVFDGFRETLPELAERYRLFIVSNCDAGYIEMFLKVTGTFVPAIPERGKRRTSVRSCGNTAFPKRYMSEIPIRTAENA